MIVDEINNQFIELFMKTNQVKAMKDKTKLRYFECLSFYPHEYFANNHQLTLDAGWYEIDDFIVYENYITSKTQLNYLLKEMINYYGFLYREAYITQNIKDAIMAMISYNREFWAIQIEASQSTSDEDLTSFAFYSFKNTL